MSHFIAQSSKIVKLTDGKQTKYLVGWIGTDNNTTGYGGQLRPECIISESNIHDFIVLQAEMVASGSIQLKDMKDYNNLKQAAYMVKRLDSNFRNAKTVQVDDLSTPELDLSKNRELCVKLGELSNNNGFSGRNVRHKEVDHDPRNKKVVDFFINYTKDPSIKSDHNSEVVELIDVMPALSGMLSQASPITEDELYVALRDGDWYNLDTSILKSDNLKNKIQNIDYANDLINNVGQSNLYSILEVFNEEIRSDRELMTRVIKQNPECIKYLPAFQKDREFIFEAIKNNYDGGTLLDKIDPQFQLDKELVKTACAYSTMDIRNINGLIANKELMLEILHERIEMIKQKGKDQNEYLISNTGYHHMRNYLNSYGLDKEIFDTSFNFSPAYTLKYSEYQFKMDAELTKKAISKYPEYFGSTPHELKNNIDVFRTFLNTKKDLLNSEEINNNSFSIKYHIWDLNNSFRDNQEIMILATSIDPNCWSLASERLKRIVGDNDPIKYFESVDLKNQLTTTLSQKEINPSQNDLDGILGNVFGNIQENSTQRLPSQSTSKKLKI